MTTGWLTLTAEQRRQALAQAQVESGIIVKALEKDWWVTLTLKALFQSKYKQWIVFKGGTSLSKGWRLINRFSEDIDIALDLTVLGMTYQEAPSKSFVEKLKRRGCAFSSNELLTELHVQFSALGVPDNDLSMEASAIPIDRPDTDPQTLYIRYKSIYAPNPYLMDEVKIEVSVRSLLTPFAKRPIISLLFENFPNSAYEEELFDVNVVEPRKTFLEKAFLLHEEFARPEKSLIRYRRMSRHFYDLVLCIAGGVDREALRDHELYEHLVRHREGYNRLQWLDYKSLRRDTLSFLPPSEMIELYKADYATMLEHMIYGDAPGFEKVMQELTALQAQFRMK